MCKVDSGNVSKIWSAGACNMTWCYGTTCGQLWIACRMKLNVLPQAKHSSVEKQTVFEPMINLEMPACLLLETSISML